MYHLYEKKIDLCILLQFQGTKIGVRQAVYPQSHASSYARNIQK